VAGNGDFGYNGDDILATKAKLQEPRGIFVTEDDELYICDSYNNRIRKVFNGTITTVVDESKESMFSPTSVFASKYNELYICDNERHRVLKVNSNGIVSTIAGTGNDGYNGDGDLATKTNLQHPWIVTCCQ